MKIYDISVPITPSMLVWPKDSSPRVEALQTIEKDGNATSLLTMGSHTGTHIDAPKHFVPGALGIDQIRLDLCIGSCQVVEAAMNGGEISARDIEGKIRLPRVLFKTKNSADKLLHREAFQKDFVGLTLDAAMFLVEKDVRLIGVDYLSCERGSGGQFKVHEFLLSRGVVIIESCDLSEVESGEFELIALPLRLKNLDGSPCRSLLLRGF